MLNNFYIISIIAGMFLVTYPVRLVPFAICNRIRVPEILKTWLKFVPVSIFAALLTQILVGTKEVPVSFNEQLPILAGSIVAVATMIKTKHFGLGMFFGFVMFLIVVFLMN